VRRNIKSKGKVYIDIEYKYNRSIKTVTPINENILRSDITGKTSYDKLLEKNNAKSLHKKLKPILIMLQLFGCFLVYFSKSSKYTHTHIHTQTDTHTQIHTQAHSYTHSHTHTRIQLSPRVPQPTRLGGTWCRSEDWHITSPSIF
jgi:hypothetical protein